MTILLVMAILTLAVGVDLICRYLRSIDKELKRNTEELRTLRLASRTRIAQASVQSGAVSEEQVLTRLGRASTARRVVVGGDDTSDLKQTLIRQTSMLNDRGGEDE